MEETKTNQTQEELTLPDLGLDQYYSNPKTKEFELEVINFYKDYQMAPIIDMNMKEDGNMDVELHQEFEKIVSEKFKDDYIDILSDYVTAVIKDFVDNLSDEDIERLKEEAEAEKKQIDQIEQKEQKEQEN